MRLVKSLVRKRRKKESYFKYLMALLHLWGGLLSSVIIFLVCLTGSIYAFKTPVSDWINRDKIYLHSIQDSVSVASFEKEFQTKFGIIESVIIPEENNKSWVVTYKEKDTQGAKTQFFDPYSVKEIGVAQPGPDRFFAFVLDLHRTLLISQVGKQIVGAAVLVFISLLVSGFVLWLPRKRKDLIQGLTIKWKAKFYRVNYDLHNTLGFYALLMLFFLAITGLYVTYPWMKSTVLVTLGGEPVLTASNPENTSEGVSSAFSDLLKDMVAKQSEKEQFQDEKMISLAQIISLTSEHLPYSGTTQIKYPDDKEPRFTIQKINNHNWLGAQFYDELSFDKKGDLKTKHLFSDKKLHQQFANLAKPLHTGEILGLKGIIFYALISFIGCMLPVTGFIIWWKKLK